MAEDQRRSEERTVRVDEVGTCSVCRATVPIDVVGGEYRIGYHDDASGRWMCRGTGSQA